MDTATLAVIISGAIILGLLFWGVPIGITLGIAAIAGAFVFTGRLNAALSIPFIVTVSVTTTYGFIVIPLFMLLGNVAAESGIARDVFDTAYRWVGRIPGGLSVSTVVTCAGMAAITGSSVGTAAAMTPLALPELRRYKYADSLSIGTIAVGGTLAIMIPPSITFVLYGIFAEQSIGKLLIAGILPGLLIAALYAIQVIIRCTVNPRLGPPGPKFSWGERFRSIVGIIPFILIVVAILGGILMGIWTPVEGSGVGAVAVLIMGLVRRRLTMSKIVKSVTSAVITSASVMVLVIGAMSLSTFLALSGYNEILTDAIMNWGLPPLGLFSVLIIIYVILGMFLEATSILALTVPLVLPVVIATGWNPIWFGVILVSLMEVAAVTPPVGLNLYAVKAAAPDIPIQTIYIGSIPFWLCNIIAILIIYFVPKIALLLPGLM